MPLSASRGGAKVAAVGPLSDEFEAEVVELARQLHRLICWPPFAGPRPGSESWMSVNRVRRVLARRSSINGWSVSEISLERSTTGHDRDDSQIAS